MIRVRSKWPRGGPTDADGTTYLVLAGTPGLVESVLHVPGYHAQPWGLTVQWSVALCHAANGDTCREVHGYREIDIVPADVEFLDASAEVVDPPTVG